MTDQTLEAYPGAGYTVPTHTLEGQPLSADATLKELMKVPKFLDGAIEPHTPESKIVDDLNARILAEREVPPPMKAASAGEFRLTYPHGVDTETAEFQQGDLAIRGWLGALGVDKRTGDSLAELAARQAQYWESQPDWGLAQETAVNDLRLVYGKDYDKKVALAQSVVADVERQSPGFAAFLDVSGLANDAMLTSFLVNIAEQKGR